MNPLHGDAQNQVMFAIARARGYVLHPDSTLFLTSSTY